MLRRRHEHRHAVRWSEETRMLVGGLVTCVLIFGLIIGLGLMVRPAQTIEVAPQKFVLEKK